MPEDRERREIERLLALGELERVTPSGDLASRLIDDARAHLASARAIQETDAAGACQLAYDAARKVGSALLAAQGLRATSRGGHMAVQEAVRGLAPAFAAFGRMRRRRHASEYPEAGTPTMTRADAVEGIERASDMLEVAAGLLASGELRVFG